MGDLAACGIFYCPTQCANGGVENPSCRLCNQQYCNPSFEQCSGLNIDVPEAPPINFVPIIGGVVGGFMALLLIAVSAGWYHRRVTRHRKMLTPDEMARIASMQSFTSSKTGTPYIDGAIGTGPESSNPKYVNVDKGSTNSFNLPPGDSQLSPYQRMYKAQQEALAKDGGNRTSQLPSRTVPSARVSQMASNAFNAPPIIPSNAIRLITTYDFDAEHSDELNVKAGTSLIGVDQKDGWWLAKTEDGVFGLIPVSYTTEDTTPGKSGYTPNPDF